MAGLPNLDIYQGPGPNLVWDTASNWSRGVVAGTTSTALFVHSANFIGPVEVGTLMLVGAETVSIDGAVKTDSTNSCESFMVCQDAQVTFNAGSTLADSGGMEIGVHGVGSVTLAAASGGLAAASLHMIDLKVGQFAAGVGTLTLADGTSVSAVGPALIGLEGQGTLNMSGTSSLTAAGFGMGIQAGGTGVLNMSGDASIKAMSWMTIGTAVQGTAGGTATVTLAGHASLESHAGVSVGTGSSVTLAGGSFIAGSAGGMRIDAGGTVSGYGQVTSVSHGVADNGTLASAGGTLVVTGNLSGTGSLAVGTGSTLDLVTSRIGVPTISFLGATGTLELAHGVSGTFQIAGFQAGDHILEAGIDHASWNGSTDVLSLSERGQVVDHLTLTGVAAGASFSVTPGIGGSVIALVPAHH